MNGKEEGKLIRKLKDPYLFSEAEQNVVNGIPAHPRKTARIPFYQRKALRKMLCMV